MKTLRLALLIAAAAACGGIHVDPIAEDGEPPTSAGPAAGSEGPAPIAPTSPYLGIVATTDVSILYPMPLAGQPKNFVRPTEAGAHGALLSAEAFEAVLDKIYIDSVTIDPPSGYDTLGLVGVRLDPCSARGTSVCTSEVRLVFQALYEKTDAGEDGDPTVGAAATDGAIHAMYDVPEAELVVMMKQILTLKAAEGGLASTVLGPHPILAEQGLGGGFAKGLRGILLEHLGDARLARVTAFDHNFNPDSDGWTFSIVDRGAGGSFVPGKIAHVDGALQLVAGSSAFVNADVSFATPFTSSATPDNVGALLDGSRPAPGTAGVATLQPALEAAVRVQSPALHTAESTDCANCHLAEGAELVADSVYGLKASGGFTHPRFGGYVREQRTVTNLHAFGYLHRKASVMRRTANESAVVAEQMEQKVK